jgi:hypothetical protein
VSAFVVSCSTRVKTMVLVMAPLQRNGWKNRGAVQVDDVQKGRMGD